MPLRQGRKPREAIPTGKAAEEELRKLKRNQRRAERRAERAAANGEGKTDNGTVSGIDPILPPMGNGKVKSVDELRAEFSAAFDELGGVAGLVAWGRRYPKEFYAIWSRVCIPRAVGDLGNPNAGGLEDMLSQLDAETIQ